MWHKNRLKEENKKMKENKNLFLTGLIYAILFMTYNLVIFMIFKNKESVFWLSYGFMVIAFTIQIVSMLLSFKNTEIETIFFGIPLVSLSIYYLLAEFFCSLVFMIFQGAGFKIAFIVQIVLLAGFSIIAIIALTARDAVQDISQVVKEGVSFIKSINVEVDMLIEKCDNLELKTALKKLATTVKYSDPISNYTVAYIEQSIMQKLYETRIYFEEQKYIEAKSACKELELLFVERNKKLLISK
jgi:hypothetical protein